MADKKDVTKLTPKQEAEINKLLKERLGYEIDISNVRAEYSSLGNDILSELRTRARIEKDMKKDAKAYIGYMQDIKETNKEIAKIEGTILALEEELKNASEERAEVLNKTIKYLKKETSELRDQNRIIAEQLKSARGFRTTIAGISADIDKVNKGFKGVKTRLDKIYDFFDVGAMFKMLKSIKTTSAEMGLIGARSLAVSKNIQRASMNTVSFGVNLEDVAKIQGSYSDELGTTDFLSEKTLANFAALGKVTGMGAEAVGKMAAEMKQVGMSSEKTAQFMSQSFNDAASMGLNATKVMKNFSQNLKMLNKYNFKGGAKSLMRMAESATKMGISMNFAAPMAEKLFDIEGAVEMSAQLQVMGGEWAKLGDPFKLMYMARNDMEGLTKSIINATKGAAFFNKETGEFEIPALEMQRLRKVAEATGLDFEQLAQSAKKAAQAASVKKQVKIRVDPKTEEFIENTAFLDEKGKAQIMVGMEKKYVDTLTEQDKNTIMQQMAQKKSIQDRARETQTFDEKLKDLINMLKVMALPIIETINNILAPKMDGLMKRLADPKFIGKVEEFAKMIGEKLPKFVDAVADFGKSILHFVKNVGKFIMEFPKTSLAIAGGIALAIGGLKWFWYGIQLGKGFNMTARVSGGTGPGGGGMGKMGRMGRMGMGAGGGLLVGGLNSIDAFSEGKTGEGVGNIAGAVIGGALGSFLGPIGTMIGAQLGSMAGGAIGGSFDTPKKMNDGIMFNPKDKFTKVNDGTMIAGTDVNGNKQLAKELSSMAPRFGNKNGLMPGKNRASTNASAPSTVNHKFDEIKFNGSIMLTTANGMSVDLSNDLLKDPKFIRSISKIVHVETDKNLKGGKVSGSH